MIERFNMRGVFAKALFEGGQEGAGARSAVSALGRSNTCFPRPNQRGAQLNRGELG